MLTTGIFLHAYLRQAEPVMDPYSSSLFALYVVVGILFGLIGILRQVWWLKILAWWTSMLLMIWELSFVILGVLRVRWPRIYVALMVSPYQLGGVMFAMVLVLAGLTTRYVVLEAYCDRLRQVSPAGSQIQLLSRIGRFMIWIYVALSVLTLVQAFLLSP